MRLTTEERALGRSGSAGAEDVVVALDVGRAAVDGEVDDDDGRDEVIGVAPPAAARSQGFGGDGVAIGL